jgi:drug/metabolite transporter (DMT)-like permease
MTSNDTSIHARDWSLLGLLSILWGGSFFFNGVVLRELPPLTLVFLRVALAALMLLPLLWLYRISFPKGLSGWKPFFAIGFLNNVLPFALIVTGQTYIPGGLASILNATTPLFAVVVMAVAGEEKLQAHRIAGVVAGLIGVVILHGDGLGFESGQGLGIGLCLGAAFSYGLSALVARRLPADAPPIGTATFQMLASAAMMTVVAGVIDRPWQLPMPGLTTWLAVLGLAALSTALAYIVFFQIMQRSGATNVMLVTLLIPVTAILLGYLLLGEKISAREIVALVIGSALLLIDGRVLKFLQR